jgi:hypothetical protein
MGISKKDTESVTGFFISGILFLTTGARIRDFDQKNFDLKQNYYFDCGVGIHNTARLPVKNSTPATGLTKKWHELLM